MKNIALPRLITFNERSTTRHLKKIKEKVVKTRATTGKEVWRAVHKPIAWRATRVEVMGRKKVMGCGK
jgi:hypothetical protein